MTGVFVSQSTEELTESWYILLYNVCKLFATSHIAAMVAFAFYHLPLEVQLPFLFGSNKTAFKLTEEGLVHGVEQVKCKKQHFESGMSSARSLLSLVSVQKANKKD